MSNKNMSPKITKEIKQIWNNDPTFHGGENLRITEHGRQWCVRAVETLNLYSKLGGDQRWPLIGINGGLVAICDLHEENVSAQLIESTLTDKRAGLGFLDIY